MSNKIQVFDLSNASDVSLTSNGFKKGDDTAKYVCKITDATIVFVGDNSKFNTDKKKKLFNTISITLPKEQSEEFKRILHFPRSNRKSSKEFLMRRRERKCPIVNTKVRSSSK